MHEILVTGGAGYIGSHTCISLIKAGYSVIIADDLSNSRFEVVSRIQEISGQKVFFYPYDVSDELELEKIFQRHSIECVIHFAGRKAVGESIQIPLDYYRTNLNTTISLCRVMQRYNIKNIVFSSSATVYGLSDNVPFTENSPLGVCTNPYGWTKWMSEQILRDLWESDPTWSVLLLRYFNPVGAHTSGRIGEDPRGLPNNLMPYITQVAVGKIKKLHIYGGDYPTPDGTGVRDYIHVMDLADGHVAAVGNAFPKTVYRCITLAQESDIQFWMYCIRSKRLSAVRFLLKSVPGVMVILLSVMPKPVKQKPGSAGKLSGI